MAIEIKEVVSKKELKTFIKFPWKLYKGVSSYVTPVIDFELSTLSKDKNPAFEHSQGRYWLAYKSGEVVGRIAGIIHGEEAKRDQKIRFGWIDFIDDLEVSKALIDTVVSWGRENDLHQIHGPMGFTDLDFEGTLIEGYNQMATQATIYNFPYYKKHFEKLGFEKAVDWTEARVKVPINDELEQELQKKAYRVSQRFGMHVKEFKSSKEMLKYADEVFALLNDNYSHLYGYFPLTQEQINYYIEQYFGMVRTDFIMMVVDDDDKVVGFAITFPSLSKAFQKANGSLYPFGFVPVLKSFYFNDTIDFFLIAAKKEYQMKGFNAVLWNRLYWVCKKHSIKYIFSGPMLEENTPVNHLWAGHESAKNEEIRRRCFIRSIS